MQIFFIFYQHLFLFLHCNSLYFDTHHYSVHTVYTVYMLPVNFEDSAQSRRDPPTANRRIMLSSVQSGREISCL